MFADWSSPGEHMAIYFVITKSAAMRYYYVIIVAVVTLDIKFFFWNYSRSLLKYFDDTHFIYVPMLQENRDKYYIQWYGYVCKIMWENACVSNGMDKYLFLIFENNV
jgi:hypothetical protein